MQSLLQRHSINRLVALIVITLGFISPTQAAGTASELFSKLRPLVFQIRVIDIASGDKYTIGSGFQIDDSGHIATNFHVVASYVHEPEKYRLELEQNNGEALDLELLSIDVVHDLAIVKALELNSGFLNLSNASLSKGDKIYSMGNPGDLGMTIIEGTYNGLVKNSRYRKILFSGSLNGGMSGGPAINQNGEVIGVNVSKGGEQLSFLVPVEHLRALVKKNQSRTPEPDFNSDITTALIADQQQFFQALLSNPTNDKTLGELNIPGKLDPSLKCWGHSVDKEDIYYQAVHQHCRSEDEIFISRALQVGEISYDYEWITTEELNPFQFYSLLQGRFNHSRLKNTYNKEEVTEFNCHTDIVRLPSGRWKLSGCFRSYKKYFGLFDALMVMASIDHNNKAAIVNFAATGVSKDNALAFMQRMAKEIEWTR